nr:LuxR C-terminal-related transcriptional regulator [Gordonia sp. NB41Y]
MELTRREQDVLALAALGYTNARIAENLGIGVHTAKGYMKDVLRKLGAAGRLEAVVIARRAGLLP